MLDVGCGLGKTTIGIAKVLKKGKVIGIDIWNRMEIMGNLPERAYENARIEGVIDKVEFKYGDVLSIPFAGNSFDIVTAQSARAIIFAFFFAKTTASMERIMSDSRIVVNGNSGMTYGSING